MSEPQTRIIRPKMFISKESVIGFKDRLCDDNEYKFFTRDTPWDLSSNMVLSMSFN